MKNLLLGILITFTGMFHAAEAGTPQDLGKYVYKELYNTIRTIPYDKEETFEPVSHDDILKRPHPEKVLKLCFQAYYTKNATLANLEESFGDLLTNIASTMPNVKDLDFGNLYAPYIFLELHKYFPNLEYVHFRTKQNLLGVVMELLRKPNKLIGVATPNVLAKLFTREEFKGKFGIEPKSPSEKGWVTSLTFHDALGSFTFKMSEDATYPEYLRPCPRLAGMSTPQKTAASKKADLSAQAGKRRRTN